MFLVDFFPTPAAQQEFFKDDNIKKCHIQGFFGKSPRGWGFFYASLVSDPDPTLPKNIVLYFYEFFNVGNIEKTLFRKFGHPNIWKTSSYYTNLHQFIDIIIKFPVDLC